MSLKTQILVKDKENSDVQGFDLNQSNGFVRHAQQVSIKKVQKYFQPGDLFSQIYKNGAVFIPSQNSLKNKIKQQAQIDQITKFLQNNRQDLKKYSFSQAFVQAQRINRDLFLSIRNREERILQGVGKLLGIAKLNSTLNRGQTG